MRRLLFIVGLLVALSGLIRTVDAQTSIVGYGSNDANEIRLIDLETGQIVPSLFDSLTFTVPFKGLAIDPAGENLYGTDQNGNLYRIEIATGAETPLGNMGIIVPDKTEIEAADFNFNGTELWVADFDSNTPTIYKINNFDTTDPIGNPISATPLQTVNPGIGGGVVRSITADTTKDVWVANDNFPSMDFQSIDTENTDPDPTNITHIGFLDDDPSQLPFIPRPKINGMDRSIDGVLYGLSLEGGTYVIDQDPLLDPATDARIVLKGTAAGHSWLALAISTADSSGGPGNGSQNAVGELEIGKENNCQNDNIGQRVARELELETYNTDPELVNIWNSLFGVDPETSPDDKLTLLGPNRTITWEAGRLEMGGLMRLKVKTDCRNPALKIVKITKAGKHQSPTLFISGTGGVNPNLADGGWHEVEIKKLDNVTVTFDGYTITGFLKKLEVELDEDSTTAAPVVDEFKLKIKGVTSAPNGCSTVNSVVIDAPQTVVTAIAGAEYEEEVNESPEVLTGHTEAEFEREPGTSTEGVDISSLLDGNNDRLKKREGPCVIEDAVSAP